MYATTNTVLEEVENLGLNPYQFRVYFHLVMRAQSDKVKASIESIYKACGLGRSTVVRVLAQLAQMKLIEKLNSTKQESVFRLCSLRDYEKIRMLSQGSTAENIQNLKALPSKDSEQCVFSQVIPERDCSQEDISTPLKGVDMSPVETSTTEKQYHTDTSPAESLDEVVEATGDLAEKIELLRSRNVLACQYRSGLIHAAGKTYSQAEFMSLPIDSFLVVKASEEQLESCWKALIPSLKRMNFFERNKFLRAREKLGKTIPDIVRQLFMQTNALAI